MTAKEERRLAWLELTPDELLALLRGEARIANLLPDGPCCDAQILAIQSELGVVGKDVRVVKVKVGLCSDQFQRCPPPSAPPTLDWRPEPVEARTVKFREFF